MITKQKKDLTAGFQYRILPVDLKRNQKERTMNNATKNIMTLYTYNETCTRSGEVCVGLELGFSDLDDLVEHRGSIEDLIVESLLTLHSRLGQTQYQKRRAKNVLDEVIESTSTRYARVHDITIAEVISDLMGGDGQRFEIPGIEVDLESAKSYTLIDLVERITINIRQDYNSGVMTYLFRDGSAIGIQANEGAWDLAFPYCQCWAEGPDEGCEQDHDIYYCVRASVRK